MQWTTNGVKSLVLKYYDNNGSQIGLPLTLTNMNQYYNGPIGNQNASTMFEKLPFVYLNAKQARITIIATYGEIEIRQIEFSGVPSHRGGFEISKTCTVCAPSNQNKCTTKCNISVLAKGPIPPGTVYFKELIQAETNHDLKFAGKITDIGPSAFWNCGNVTSPKGDPFYGNPPKCEIDARYFPIGTKRTVPVYLEFLGPGAAAESINCVVLGFKAEGNYKFSEKTVCVVPDGSNTINSSYRPDKTQPPTYSVTKICQPCQTGALGNRICNCQISFVSAGGNPNGGIEVVDSLQFQRFSYSTVALQNAPQGVACAHYGPSHVLSCTMSPALASQMTFSTVVSIPSGASFPIKNCVYAHYFDSNG